MDVRNATAEVCGFGFGLHFTKNGRLIKEPHLKGLSFWICLPLPFSACVRVARATTSSLPSSKPPTTATYLPTATLLRTTLPARSTTKMTLLNTAAGASFSLPDTLAIVAGRLTTTRTIEANDLLVEVPRQSVLMKDDAQLTPLLRYLDPASGTDRPPDLPHWEVLPDAFVLSLLLAHKSKSAPLVMPVLNGTLHWTAAERAWLEGSHVLSQAAQQSERIDRQLDTLLAPLLAHDPDFFNAAFAPTRMRAILHHVHAHALVPAPLGRPVLLLNLPHLRLHHRAAAALTFDRGTQRIALRASRRIAPSEEVSGRLRTPIHRRRNALIMRPSCAHHAPTMRPPGDR